MKLLCLLFFFAFLAPANDAPIDTFSEAIRFYQQGKYAEAAEHFEKQYRAGGESPSVLFNWGLAVYQMQKKGYALGLWRRALYLDPDFSAASTAIQFISEELPGDVISPMATGFESFNQAVLNKFSLEKMLIVVALFLAGSGFLAVRYLSERKNALLKTLPLPKPPITALVFFLGFIFAVTLGVGKAYSLSEVRATVISNSSTMRTGPSIEDNPVFELIEGLEVVVRNLDTSWAQVKLPGGVSGWVPTSELFQSTGEKRLW